MTAKSTAKNILAAGMKNKVARPVIIGAATPVFVISYIPMVCWQTRKSVMH